MKDGKLCLTSYARSHVDECCLVFEQISRANNRYGISYYRECYLCRDIYQIHLQKRNMWRHRIIKQKKKRQQKVKNIKRGSKNSKNSTRVTGWLWRYFKISHEALEVTVEKLEELSLVGYKTIQTMRNNEAVNKSLRNVVAICIGLHLHPLLSEDLIRKSGNTFKSTEEDFVLQFLVHNHYKAFYL